MACTDTFQPRSLDKGLKSVNHTTVIPHVHSNVTFIIRTKDDASRVERNSVGGMAKSAINSHIARLSHARRRQQRAKEAETVLLPAPIPLPPFVNNGNISETSGFCDGRQTLMEPQQYPEPLSSSFCDSEGAAPSCRAPEPLTILQKGNSDPFNSYTITIDAWANRFMEFGKAFLIPALYQAGKRGWAPSSPAARNWHAGIRDLSDECAAFGLMAYYATALTIISGDRDVVRRALIFKTKALELLRSRMTTYAQYGSRLDASAQGLVFRLFRTEILGRNPGAALVHGNMLRTALDKQGSVGAVDLGFLTTCIYHDNHRSTSAMQRPIFDYEDFVPNAFAPAWRRMPLELPQEDEANLGDPDPSILCPVLRKIMSEMRPYFRLYTLMATKRQTTASTTDWFWFLSKSEMFQGRLMNQYLDLTVAATNQPSDLRYEVAKQLQACLCLATLFTIRSPVNNPTVSGTPVYTSGSVILRRLSDGLRFVEAHLVYDPTWVLSAGAFNNALLWAYYVGALAGLRWSCYQTSDHFFAYGLSRKIQDMKIDSWSQMASNLQKFLYSEVYCAPQHPEQWFETIRRTDTD